MWRLPPRRTALLLSGRSFSTGHSSSAFRSTGIYVVEHNNHRVACRTSDPGERQAESRIDQRKGASQGRLPNLETNASNFSSTLQNDIVQDVPLVGRDLQQLTLSCSHGSEQRRRRPASNFGFDSEFGTFPDPTHLLGSGDRRKRRAEWNQCLVARRQPQHFQLWGKHRGQPLSRFRVGISGHYQRLLSRVLPHRGWRFSQLLRNCDQTAFAFAEVLEWAAIGRTGRGTRIYWNRFGSNWAIESRHHCGS
jgi:hypothetical protein